MRSATSAMQAIPRQIEGAMSQESHTRPDLGVSAWRASFVVLAVGAILTTAIGRDLPVTEGLISIIMFAHQDIWWFWGNVLIAAALWWSRKSRYLAEMAPGDGGYWQNKWTPLVGAVAVFFASAIGQAVVYHGFALSMDEFMAEFQARIFGQGELLAPVTVEWRPFVRALQPIFMISSPTGAAWGSAYLPLNSALRALLSLVSLEALTGALTSTIAVLATWAVARRLWPGDRAPAVVAVALLATSAQLLVTAMTSYAMPAHLALNMVWLWLFLRDDRLGHGFAPLVGVTAAGLHQLHVHAFFVAPFMIDLLVRRRWRLAAWYAAIYGAGHLLWAAYFPLVLWLTLGPGQAESLVGQRSVLDTIESLIAFPDFPTLMLMTFNLLRFAAWENLLLIPLGIAALMRWSVAPRPIRLLAWSIAASLLPSFFLLANQGHGWGYRYLHGLIGAFVLIAAQGYAVLARETPDRVGTLRGLVAVGSLATLVLMLPLRAVQVERFLRPYAEAVAFIESRPADLVLVDHTRNLFAQDLVRNDPYLERRPRVMLLGVLDGTEIAGLCARWQTEIVGPDQLGALGIPLRTGSQDEPSPVVPAGCRMAAGG